LGGGQSRQEVRLILITVDCPQQYRVTGVVIYAPRVVAGRNNVGAD
jgi:hypothetical protein